MRDLFLFALVCFLLCCIADGVRISHKLRTRDPLIPSTSTSTSTSDLAAWLKVANSINTPKPDPFTLGYFIKPEDSEKYCQSHWKQPTVTIQCCYDERIPINNMDDICQYEYGASATAYAAGDVSDPKSWFCKQPITNMPVKRFGIDIPKYCTQLGYGTANYAATSTSISNVWSWYCTGRKLKDYPLNTQDTINQVCQSQSPNPANFVSTATYGNVNDPKSWTCTTNYMLIGRMNMDEYCYKSVLPSCGGTTRATVINQKWYCVGRRTVDLNEVCRSKGMVYDSTYEKSGLYKCK